MSFVLYSEHINVGDRSLRQCVTFACDRNVKARIYNSKEKQKIRFDFHDDDDDGARRDIFRRLLLFLQNSRTTIFSLSMKYSKFTRYGRFRFSHNNNNNIYVVRQRQLP